MLKGYDVSHYQYGTSLANTIIAEGNNEDIQFLFAKATEGVGWKDKTLVHWARLADEYGLIFGMYHYARPDINKKFDGMMMEAEWFLQQVHYIHDSFPQLPIILALDWEGKAIKTTSEWALNWLQAIEDKLGTKPLLYCSQANLKSITDQIPRLDYGLWVARYNKEVGNVTPWDFWAFWQYTSKPWDKDYFNGTYNALLKYAYRGKEITVPDENKCATCASRNKDCGCCPKINE